MGFAKSLTLDPQWPRNCNNHYIHYSKRHWYNV